MTVDKFILESAKLRGQAKFDEAIELIESKRQLFDSTTLVPALLEAFKAAHEMGDTERARKYAMEIEIHEPKLPSIQIYLR